MNYDNKDLSAEERRRRIREKLEESIKKEKEIQQSDINIIKRENTRKKEQEERERKFKEEEAKKKEQKELTINADKILDEAKTNIKEKKFKEARDNYRKVISIFKTLGWWDQVDVLYKEIKNIENLKEQHLKKVREQKEREQYHEEQFQKRVDNVLTQKKREEEIAAAKKNALPPEIQEKIKKIQMIREKAEKEENMLKIDRAVSRYQVILDLYNSIPKEMLDITKEVSEIENKLAELTAKK